MKKLWALLLVGVLMFSLTACGSKKTELTLDNYEKYLEVNMSCSESGDGVRFMNPVLGYTGSWYPQISGRVKVSGVSSNYDYNDVVITVEISGTYDDYGAYTNEINSTDNEFEMSITVETDIAGNGENFDKFALGEKLVTRNALIDGECKVVDISGTVTPAQ